MGLILTPKQLLVDDRKQSSYFRFADNSLTDRIDSGVLRAMTIDRQVIGLG